MSTFRLLLVFLLSPVLLLAGGTTISGKVALPEGKTRPVMNKRYEIVSKAGILATDPPLAVVYLDGNFPCPTNEIVAQVAQKDFAFKPALLAIQMGTKVEFPNEDNAYHNVFSYSAPKRFDLGRFLPSETPVPSQTFDTPGLITLRCDIHEHMRGLILVLPTPYFVITAPDGAYELKGLPQGHYVLKAWINSRTTLEKAIDVPKDGALTVDFTP